MGAHRHAAALLATAMFVGGCTTSGDPAASPPSKTPGATSDPAVFSTPSFPATEPQASEESAGNPELARVLNEHLSLFLEQAGFSPLGGDHDWMNASNTVETDNGTVVSVFIYPVERADLGDASFEQVRTAVVGETTVELGRRSDEQAAARFDCGDFQFQFLGEEAPAVEEVAVAIANEVQCPLVLSTPTSPDRP